MAAESFDQALRRGRIGEGLIARWLNRRGWHVLPAYEIEIAHGKGPRLFMADSTEAITPDLLIFKQRQFLWVEAKSKSAFTWHRNSQTWQTGIDRRHWHEYLRVAKETQIPVWLMFLHHPDGVAKDTPTGMRGPSGLFVGNLEHLKSNVHHEHDNHGPTGMVYWTHSVLTLAAEYYEIDDDALSF